MTSTTRDRAAVRAIGVRADYAHARVTLLPQALNVLMADLAIHEYLGVLRYHVYNWLGWNVQAVKPTYRLALLTALVYKF